MHKNYTFYIGYNYKLKKNNAKYIFHNYLWPLVKYTLLCFDLFFITFIISIQHLLSRLYCVYSIVTKVHIVILN